VNVVRNLLAAAEDQRGEKYWHLINGLFQACRFICQNLLVLWDFPRYTPLALFCQACRFTMLCEWRCL